MSSSTDKFIHGLYSLTQIELPESVVYQAKRCLLDYIGVTFAGARLIKEKGLSFIASSDNCGDKPIIGFNKRSNFYNAAFINGMSAHIAELDDGYRQGSVHLGAPIISALLPIVQHFNLTGHELLKGMIVGYEAAIIMASVIQPSHRNKGYHATGTCGTIGASLGISAALGFTKQQMKNALATASTSASGMLNITKGGSELKPYNAGQAAVSGIIAALTSKAGFNGPDCFLTGEWGFINMVADVNNLSILDTKHEDTFGIQKVYLKPYAACRHCHPAIDAALLIKGRYNINLDEIEKIKIITYNLGTKGHDHTEILGISSAKMSTPFSVAVSLITGKAGIEEFSEEFINRPDIISLTKKIKIIGNDSLNSLVPQKRPAIVEIYTNNNIFKQRIDLAKGEPENPLSDHEAYNKFSSLSSFGGKSHKHIEQIHKFCFDIENNLHRLQDLL